MKYRIPTSIPWNNNGWREVTASNLDEALIEFRVHWPLMRIDLQTVQIFRGNGWNFAQTTPDYLGGYDKGRYA